MDNIGNTLKAKRKKHELSIKEVEKHTNIRAHIIEALENGSGIALPAPYIKSFIKTLENFYEQDRINIYTAQDIDLEANKPINREKDDISHIHYYENENKLINSEPISSNNDEKEIIEFDDIGFEIPSPDKLEVANAEKIDYLPQDEDDIGFEVIAKTETPKNKKKQEDKSQKNTIATATKKNNEIKANRRLNQKTKNTILYAAVGLFFISVIYLVFFYKSSEDSSNIEITANVSKKKVDNDSDNAVLVIEEKNKLFSYFVPSDSLTLVAKCKDTAWIKVEIDGKSNDELLMLPHMEKRWTAYEYIQLSTSRVGSIKFYKNDTLLPNLGVAGSMVKNIKITREGIANVHPLENQRQAVSANKIDTNYRSINKTTENTANTQQPKRVNKNKKKKEERKPILLPSFSTPPVTKPPILN